MIKKIVICISVIMVLLFIGIFIKVKMHFYKIEVEAIESQTKYNNHIKMMDSLFNLENEKQKLRIEYAKKLEMEFRKNQLRAIVTTSGATNKTLKLTCIFFNTSTLKEDSMKNSIDMWRKLGFTKVIISDGYQNSYTLKLY